MKIAPAPTLTLLARVTTSATLAVLDWIGPLPLRDRPVAKSRPVVRFDFQGRRDIDRYDIPRWRPSTAPPRLSSLPMWIGPDWLDTVLLHRLTDQPGIVIDDMSLDKIAETDRAILDYCRGDSALADHMTRYGKAHSGRDFSHYLLEGLTFINSQETP